METRSQPGKVTHPPISGSGGQYQAEEPVLSPLAGIFGWPVSAWRPPSFQFKGLFRPVLNRRPGSKGKSVGKCIPSA